MDYFGLVFFCFAAVVDMAYRNRPAVCSLAGWVCLFVWAVRRAFARVPARRVGGAFCLFLPFSRIIALAGGHSALLLPAFCHLKNKKGFNEDSLNPLEKPILS